jgi:hypothetical protein
LKKDIPSLQIKQGDYRKNIIIELVYLLVIEHEYTHNMKIAAFFPFDRYYFNLKSIFYVCSNPFKKALGKPFLRIKPKLFYPISMIF